MGDTSRALGIGSSLVFNGKTYQVAPLTIDGRAYFETWLERRALAAVNRVNYDDEAEKSSDKAAVYRDIASGVYSFGSSAFVKAAKSLPGQKQLLYLMMEAGNPGNGDVDEHLVDKIFEEALEEAMEAMGAAEAEDPNSKAPPAVAAGNSGA